MNRRIMMITGGVLVVMIALWYVFGFKSQSDDLNSAKSREETARTTNEQLQLRISQLKAARKDMPKLTATVERLRRAIPDEANLAEFILQAHEIAEESGVDWLNIAPTPAAVSETPNLPAKIVLNISVDGGYFQVLDYLNRLSELPRIVIIDGISLTPGEVEGSTGAPRMSAVLTGRMFATKAGVAAAEGEGTIGAGSTTTTVAGGPSATTIASSSTTTPATGAR